MTLRLLLVEDEVLLREQLCRLLERHGHQVTQAGNVAEACRLPLQAFDAIVTDVRLPDESGLTLIEKVRPLPVVVMTSFEDTRQAVAAMRSGALNYLIKPFDPQELLTTLQQVSGRGAPPKPACTGLGELVGQSSPMQRLYADIQQVADTPATVLITGESGTGKELVARALHQLSRRHNQPLMAVNCAAIPESLIEGELFGHEKGAFTGAHGSRMGLVEAADRGTLFLDEIGELPLEAQARLLRLLQEKEVRRLGAHTTRKVNIRLIAATHRDLVAMQDMGRFRADLYFRLNVVTLHLPPLRERLDDLPLLCQHLLGRLCAQHGRAPLQLSAAALARLQAHPWPGNVRELQNVLEYSVLMCRDDCIDASGLRLPALRADAAVPHPSTDAAPEHLAESAKPTRLLDQQFATLVRQLEATLTESELARQLGISRKTLWEKRQRLNLPRKPRRRDRL